MGDFLDGNLKGVIFYASFIFHKNQDIFALEGGSWKEGYNL
jgi:hypothetical protein